MKSSQEEVFDSPSGWVASHIRRYAETDGHDGDRYLVVASQGGAKRNPSWYLNLTKNPDVELQVGPDKFPARARTATPEEKPKLWQIMTSIWPDYDQYQARCERDIPVVILEPASAVDKG